MKILLDQGAPLPLRQFLKGHSVIHLSFLGWSKLANGQLLARAENNGFDCLVTTDKNLRYQQNLASRRIAIFVLSTTNWPLIKSRAFEIAAAILSLKPQDYVEFVV